MLLDFNPKINEKVLLRKVLILGKLPPPYFGPAVVTDIILKSRLKQYFNLYFLNTQVNKDLNKLGEVSFKKAIDNLKLYGKLFILLFKNEPDLVVVPISQTTIGFFKDSFFILISRLMLKRTILYLHGSNLINWFNELNLIAKQYFKSIISSCNGAIVLGNNLKYLFYDFFSSEEIYVVPNGLDFNFQKMYKKQQDIVTILYLANLQPTKGIQDLIIAINILDEIVQSNFRVRIVGNWRDNKTEEFCKKFKMANSLPISFLPAVFNEAKIDEYLHADIFVFPPRAPEGHPLVIVEAMAAGLPIISTDQGAIIESVFDGVNGFIVEKENPRQIAEKLKILIEDPELRIKMGRESRRIYEEKFTEEKMVENLKNVFEKVIEKDL